MLAKMLSFFSGRKPCTCGKNTYLCEWKIHFTEDGVASQKTEEMVACPKIKEKMVKAYEAAHELIKRGD